MGQDATAGIRDVLIRGSRLLLRALQPAETPPKQHQFEKRCYIRVPDGHLIEVGQTTDPEGDWSPAHWPSSTPGSPAGG